MLVIDSVVSQALQESTLKVLSNFMTQQQLAALENLLPLYRSDCQAILTFLIGISSSGYEYQERYYASLALLQEVLLPSSEF